MAHDNTSRHGTHAPGGRFERLPLLEQQEYKSAEDLINKFFPAYATEKDHVGPMFTKFMTFIVLLNCAQIGAEIQWSFEEYPFLTRFYFSLDMLFLTIFMLEVAIKICWMRCKPYFDDNWNRLDLFLTIMLLVQTVVELMGNSHVADSIHELGNVAKLARCLRLIRLLRVLKAQTELVIVVEGLVRSRRPLFWIVITLIVITYIFAVFFVMSVNHDIFADSNVDPKATSCEKDVFFCDMKSAMQTLLDIIVGDEWSNVSHPITQHQPWLLLPLNIFLIATVFGVTNVIVGVIVDATAETKTRLKFRKNRIELLEASKMWEEKIVKAGLKLESLDNFKGDTLEAKRQDRREKVEEIVKQIIESNIIDFPTAARPSAVLSLLSRNTNGEINHEDFTVSMGRLLMADDRKLIFQVLINHAIGMNLMRDVMAKVEQMDAKLDNMLKSASSTRF